MFNSNEMTYKLALSIIKRTRPQYNNGKRIHPVLWKIIKEHTPADWQQMILELPHLASDGVSIGYYRNDNDVGKKVTITRPGKYVKRHFPNLADNVIRDYVNPYIIKTQIIDNIESIIEIMESDNVPTSCMSKGFNIHPYRVYDPKFGWKLVIKKNNEGNILGRALVNNMHYVRAYTSSTSSNTGISIDCALEAWLDSQGYENLGKWPSGTKLAKITDNYDNIIAPYIDGNNDNIDVYSDYCKIVNDGEYECRNTDGTAEEKNRHTCDICGDRHAEDDCAYIDNEGSVCPHCIDSYFVYIESVRIGRTYLGGYYIRENDAIRTENGDYYPSDSYSDFNIVCLHNGDYVDSDDTVYCESDNEYYLCEDIGDKLAYCEDLQEYSTDFWQCAESNNYYSDNQDFAYDSNGDKIHPDYASEELKLVSEK